MIKFDDWRLIKRILNRIGVERLWQHKYENRWAVSLDNRTYHNWFEIPLNRIKEWKKVFNLKNE